MNLMQAQLNVPKKNEAKGGNGRTLYKYRSCEDILEASKNLLKELKCTLVVTDEVVQVANRIYIKATATLTNEEGISVSTSAFAREPETLAAMNPSQVTGAASSYARKYALNGLLAIDDTEDADMVRDESQAPFPPQQQPSQQETYEYQARERIDSAMTGEELMKVWNEYPGLQGYQPFVSSLTARRKALGIKNSNEK